MNAARGSEDWSWDSGPSDEELLASFRSGAEHAFDILVARHGPRIRRYLVRIVGPSNDEEDLVQEVFLRVHRHLGKRREKAGFRVWLFRIARGVAVDHIRVERSRRRALEGRRRLPEPSPFQSRPLEEAELRRGIDAALARLPEVLRSAFALREIEGLSYAEIARVMKSSEKTVSTRIHRARLRLREELIAAGWIETPRKARSRSEA